MMSAPVKLLPGKPEPQGCTVQPGGFNFAVHSPWAEKVELCLFSQDTEEEVARYTLREKSGKIWHGFLPGLDQSLLYGYRVHGKHFPEMGLCFDPDKLLIDPYAKCLNRPLSWSKQSYQGDSQFMIPKAKLAQNDTFDWQGVTSPDIERSQLSLYELHVKGFTRTHPDVDKVYQGKFLGLCQPPVIDYLKSLGVTCLQLLPVASFMPEPFISEKGLTNYWGYNPVNFFAPDCRHVVLDAIDEFKTMVRELHRNGIKVILDVVFNHTAESGLNGPILSFKGFDNKGFYLFEKTEGGGPDYTRYTNNSGCGNSINMDDNFAMRLIIDALRYWVSEMHVDGFRFDLSASLAREHNEFRHNSTFFRILKQDPVLSDVILVAEPWDLGQGGYRLGHFPVSWHECNDKYRDRIRAFWRGDKSGLGDFATRLMGSRDIFPKNHRRIQASVNYVTYHDGYTLQDLVSYNERQNEANGELNRDGSHHNLSCNYGEEGNTFNPDIIELRLRQKRNFFTTLLVSQGIPHLLAGDEIGRTQQGNNNAYCQDNEISWINWNLKKNEKSLLGFCKRMIGIRKRFRLLRDIMFEDDMYYQHPCHDKACWYNPDGSPTHLSDWHDKDSNAFALLLKTDDNHPEPECLLLLVNACEEARKFRFERFEWKLLLDTRYDEGLPNASGLQQAGRAITSDRPDDSLHQSGDSQCRSNDSRHGLISDYRLIGRNIAIFSR
ncbi:MAG: glycogen debranching enzyme GlgX [Proteobacteria bacterium]|nr:MAG: glycogen debranching enzyme GlgX [Pseudomonadota bacterium]